FATFRSGLYGFFARSHNSFHRRNEAIPSSSKRLTEHWYSDSTIGFQSQGFAGALSLLPLANRIPSRVHSHEVQNLLHTEENYANKNSERTFCDAPYRCTTGRRKSRDDL